MIDSWTNLLTVEIETLFERCWLITKTLLLEKLKNNIYLVDA